MAEIEPGPDNDYQVTPTQTFSRELWNNVMASIAVRLKARELLEATFEVLVSEGVQAALDMISQNVAPQLEALTEQINALEEQLEDIIGGGTAPNAIQLGGQNPSYYLSLANMTGTLPVEKVTGVGTLIASAIAGLKGSPAVGLDTVEKLAAAVGGDANFAASVAGALGTKAVRASNLSDLTDKDAALVNILGGAVGIAVFKAATKAAARAAIDAVSKVGGDTLTGDYATDISFSAASGRAILGFGGYSQLRLYDPAAPADQRRSYINNSAGVTDIGLLNDAVTVNNPFVSFSHSDLGSTFYGTAKYVGNFFNTYVADTSSRSTTVAHGALIGIVGNFSGLVIVNDRVSGAVALFLCGGGSVYAVAGATAQITGSHAAPQSGYAFYNQTGATGTFSVMAFRTRDGA